ncbi:MAG: hypothetical protein JO258_21255 [Alphaproteobacteria bacterium]|nr:hypothetical protein [Alphaproteobacteria bacterium]
MDASRRRALCGACAGLAAVAVALGLLLQACFGPEPPAAALPASAAPSHLVGAEALAPFFAALASSASTRQPVRIVQIGDSHTANDAFSGRLRELLQARFGAAGRGWLPAGIPFKYYRPGLVTVSENGWRHVKPADGPDWPLGLDGVAAVSQPPAGSMTLESADAAGFDRFAVEYLTGTDGAAFTVAADGAAPRRVPTAAATSAIRTFALPLDRPARRLELAAEGHAPVVLLGWSAERRGPGVIYENHGTIGATIDLVARMNPGALAVELAERRPGLLVIAFGTNEGFDDRLDPARYGARFAAGVEALGHAAPGVPILILGTPDGNRIAGGCTATSCQARHDDCAWHPPPNLAAVREVQRSAAARRGWAYWDWYDAMGGRCSIDRMASAEPPLAAPDHVHLTGPGYRAMADLLFGDLMRAYENVKAPPRTT